MSSISINLNTCPGVRCWYVIYTKPHSEDVAKGELEKKGISVFLPKITKVRRQKHILQEHIQPLFPNYLFARVAIPDDYYDVKWTRGVKRMVGNGQHSDSSG